MSPSSMAVIDCCLPTLLHLPVPNSYFQLELKMNFKTKLPYFFLTSLGFLTRVISRTSTLSLYSSINTP